MKQMKSLLLLGLVCSFLGSSVVLAQEEGSDTTEISQVEEMVTLAERASAGNQLEASKQAVQAAIALANKTKINLQAAQDAVKKAQDALNNIDVVKIGDVSQFKNVTDGGNVNGQPVAPEDKNLFMTHFGGEVISTSSLTVSQSDKNQKVNVKALTTDQKLAMSHIYANATAQLRKQFGTGQDVMVTQSAIDAATRRAIQYQQRGLDPRTAGHLPGIDNLVSLGTASHIKTLDDLKRTAYNAFMMASFDDSRANWAHLNVNLYANGGVGLAIANINGEYWLVVVMGDAGTHIIANPNDPTTLQATLTQAQANLTQAQAADSRARTALNQAQARLTALQSTNSSPSKSRPGQQVSTQPAHTKATYRLYHPGIQRHLYTQNLTEADVLKGRGWNFEGEKFRTATSGKPVYRLYHEGTREHIYTTDANERKVLPSRGWRYEGVAWHSSGKRPVYRLYHAGLKVHLYTSDTNEKNILSKRGWTYEGISFYTL